MYVNINLYCIHVLLLKDNKFHIYQNLTITSVQSLTIFVKLKVP